jgi:hypothetical protein
LASSPLDLPVVLSTCKLSIGSVFWRLIAHHTGRKWWKSAYRTRSSDQPHTRLNRFLSNSHLGSSGRASHVPVFPCPDSRYVIRRLFLHTVSLCHSGRSIVSCLLMGTRRARHINPFTRQLLWYDSTRHGLVNASR